MTQTLRPTTHLRAVPHRDGRRPWRAVRATILFTSLAVTPANGANELALNVMSGSRIVRPGDVVTLTLDVTNLAVPINGIQTFVHYDPDVLRFVDVLGNGSVGSGWTAITNDRGGGDFLQLLIMLGGETSKDHTAATLTFEALAVGSTSVTFLPDEAPLRAKLTATADATPMSPVTLASEEILVVGADVPTVSDWGLTMMALALMVMGSILSRGESKAAYC